jgi:hypothetical protein
MGVLVARPVVRRTKAFFAARVAAAAAAVRAVPEVAQLAAAAPGAVQRAAANLLAQPVAEAPRVVLRGPDQPAVVIRWAAPRVPAVRPERAVIQVRAGPRVPVVVLKAVRVVRAA